MCNTDFKSYINHNIGTKEFTPQYLLNVLIKPYLNE